MRLRLRGPSGSTAINLPTESATVQDLFDIIIEKTSVPAFDIKYGYPPQPLRIDKYDKTTLLSSLDVKLDGEQLIISEKESLYALRGNATSSSLQALAKTRPPPRQGPALSSPDQTQAEPSKGVTFSAKSRSAPPPPTSLPPPRIPIPSALPSFLTLLSIPDDNSCLFTSLTTALLPVPPALAANSVTELRSLVASTIQSDPTKYTKAILDNQSPDDYCRWITTPDAWGGGIELSILSVWFGVEVCVIDVKSGRIERFNEGEPGSDIGRRVVLVYSGIHYDVITVVDDDEAEEPYDKEKEAEVGRKVFDIQDAGILPAAQQLCARLMKRGYYTDTKAFAVRCNVCGVVVKGEQGASQHAEDTGHVDFGEQKGENP